MYICKSLMSSDCFGSGSVIFNKYVFKMYLYFNFVYPTGFDDLTGIKNHGHHGRQGQ